MLGLGFAGVGLGTYITMRIFNIPDITTDGSFTLGGAVTAVLLFSGYPVSLSFLLSFAAGALAGTATGIIHTRLRVNPLLAGILVMTALYSVNLGIMGRSNIPLLQTANVFTLPEKLISPLAAQLIILLAVAFLLWLLIASLLRTDFGLTMRATGNNEEMIRALGVHTGNMKVTGLAIANGLIALSGSLITQVQGFADINMGIGIVILGLGAVMIGEMVVNITGRSPVPLQLLGVIAGGIIFRLVLAFALSIGIDALYLKLVVSVFVLIVVGIPAMKKSS